ncbi:MAG: hypothetical protein MUF34_30725 [Polyangiaceae bacterium]|jgi:hypothetical protein|nr:hypothetical protein [Polyangiaceae bacterium]
MSAEELLAQLKAARFERAGREVWKEIERLREMKQRQSFELAEVRERARRSHDDAMLGRLRRWSRHAVEAAIARSKDRRGTWNGMRKGG